MGPRAGRRRSRVARGALTLSNLSHDQRGVDTARPPPAAPALPLAAASAALAAALAAARMSRHMDAVCVACACCSHSLHALAGPSHTKQKQLPQNSVLALKRPLTHFFSAQFSRACGNWRAASRDGERGSKRKE